LVDYSSAIGDFVIGFSPIESGGSAIVEVTEDGYLDKVIPSYLYWQYRDDDNLQAFVDAQNVLAQRFIDWFRALDLPIYTKDPVSGALLDWVGAGLYGYPRPVLGSGTQTERGPFDTWQLDSIQLNTLEITGNFTPVRVTDDLYRRILTWHLYRGDGRQLTVRWLKRRVMRFLTGTDGGGGQVDATYRVSVSFGLAGQINITLIRFISGVTDAACFDTFLLNTTQMNQVVVSSVAIYPPFEFGRQLKEAIEQGVLELPFQYTGVVNVQ
jgi:hypothetical protein